MARAARAGSGSTQSRLRRTGGSWTDEEDQRLSRLVKAHGERAWVKVAQGFNNARDKKQCRERWCNHVNPNINCSPFSADENIFIIDFYIRNGRQWARMSRSKELQGRPDNSIKNHFNTNLLSHYIDLCKQHGLPQRQSDNIDPIEEDVYDIIRGKVTAPPSAGVRGVKASRFVPAFSCKIESLVNTSPKTINERRRRAQTLQDIATASSSRQLLTPGGPGPSTSSSLMRYDQGTSKWKAVSMEDMQGYSSQWTQPQNRVHLSPYEDTMEWSGSEYSMPSPSTQGNGHSPYTCSERSLARLEDQASIVPPQIQPAVVPWCDASGYFSLPPLVRTSPPPTPSALFSTLSFQSNVDEEQKALLHKRSNIGSRDRTEILTRSPSRSLLFSTM